MADITETPVVEVETPAAETAVEQTAEVEKSEGATWEDLQGDTTETETHETIETKAEPAAVATADKEDWQRIAEEAGVEVKSKEDLVKALKNPKEVYINDKDPDIRKWRAFSEKNDKDLVTEELRASGWEEDDIADRIESLEESGELKYKAKEIRTSLNQAIVEKQRTINQKEIDDQQYSKNFAATINKNVEQELSKTSDVLGFKVARDEAGTKKWRENTTKFINSGGFGKEIDAILKEAHDGKPQRLIELSQFLRSKDGIVKGLKQVGKSEKAQEILSELENSGNRELPKGERNAEGKTSKGWFSDPDLKKQAGLKE